ncbi:NAD-dependent epimerase/dehydratase family protein [Erythrobacter dokdonensis]|uniref:Putative nucleoside-diphosphate-sugar epimerase n=1 Tax=Erythrobacter dokdonensis DSW-74 TaxID=1300349 RepID=A0A1A7BG01_9SPHN|nr:NAD(P)H-binding protein [Erythrobacter dokdonensis]OBV10150.1 putative nucleoside-diphosphate-sugar epimerase [Erythrobacter dokdonensis DSW-74]
MSLLAITGATGFVGSAVLDAALAQGHQVRALARREQAPRAGAEWVRGDLDDAGALAAMCEGADALLHVAGLTNTPDPAEFETANVTGTARVIEAMRGAGVTRLVFVSSLAAREPKLSAYGASKARAETVVEASGLDWTIIRPPGVYGPRDTDYLEMFRTAKWGFVPLPPGGASSIIHVADLAELLVALAVGNAAPTKKKVYEPDDGREGGWSHKELALAIGKAVGRPSVFAPHLPRAVLDLAAGADRLVRGDRAKLTPDRVGYMTHPNWVSRFDRAVPPGIWQPRIGGEEGLRATADWYRREGWL